MRRREEYRGLLGRWQAIRELQLDSANIDPSVVRLEPLGANKEGGGDTAVAPDNMMEQEVKDEGDAPYVRDRAAGTKRRRLAGESERENEQLNRKLLRAVYLGNRDGGDGGEGDNVGVPLATAPAAPEEDNGS